MSLLDWPKPEKQRVLLDLTEIEAPHIIEIIAERFDYQSIALMTKFAFVYGGAVRDVLAGLPILGDLDIATSSAEYSYLVKAFSSSMRWTRENMNAPRPSNRVRNKYHPEYRGDIVEEEIEDEPYPEEDDAPEENVPIKIPALDRVRETVRGQPEMPPETTPKKILSGTPRQAKGGFVGNKTKTYGRYVEGKQDRKFHLSERNNPYDKEAVPMENMSVFTTLNNIKAHIICAKRYPKWDGSTADAALNLVRNVDMVCCGIAMNKDGQVFEVVKGAYEDCKNRVLRLNIETDSVHIPRMIERIDRLVKRGWKNEVDIKEAEKLLKKTQARVDKEREKAVKEIARPLKKRDDKDSKNRDTVTLSPQLYEDIYGMEMSPHDRKAIVDNQRGSSKRRNLTKKQVVNIWIANYESGKRFMTRLLERREEELMKSFAQTNGLPSGTVGVGMTTTTGRTNATYGNMTSAPKEQGRQSESEDKWITVPSNASNFAQDDIDMEDAEDARSRDEDEDYD